MANEGKDEVSYPILRRTKLITNDLTGVRDPYALDGDEDIVMVNAEADGEFAEKSRRRKSKNMVRLLQFMMCAWITADSGQYSRKRHQLRRNP